MEIEYLNIESHRKDITEGNINNIEIYWNTLSNEQRVELFNISIEEKNYKMLDYFYQKEQGKNENEKGVEWSLDNKAIITMAKKGEIELVKYYITKAYWFFQKVEIEDNLIDDLIYLWSSKRVLEVVPYLDKSKIKKSTPTHFFIQLIEENYTISPQNKLTPANKKYQDVLDFFADLNMDIVNDLTEVITATIENYSANFIDNLYHQFINNEDFIKEMIRRNDEKTSIDSKKENVLNNSLKIAIHYRKTMAVSKLISYKADLLKIEPQEIGSALLGGDLFLIKMIVESGVPIENYHEATLKRYVKQNNWELIQYFAILFENKRKTLSIINETEVNKKSLVFFGEKNNKLKEETLNYIDKILFKESLDSTLGQKEYKTQVKL